MVVPSPPIFDGRRPDNAAQPLALPRAALVFTVFPARGGVAQLKQAGLAPVTVLPVEQGKPVLLLYDTPDRLLSSTDLDGSALLDGYRALLSAPVSSPRLTLWRLATLDAAQLDRIFSGDPPPEHFGDLHPPDPDPLAALVTGGLGRSVPRAA